VQRVAVAIERRELDPVLGERGQVRLPSLSAHEELVDRDVRCADEAAGVDLRAVEAEVAEDRQRLLEGLVVQAGRVGTEFHDEFLTWWESGRR
jgi:hypothetical protein